MSLKPAKSEFRCILVGLGVLFSVWGLRGQGQNWSEQYLNYTAWKNDTPNDSGPKDAPEDETGVGKALGPGCGMGAWAVTEPLLCLWLYDVPVWYQPGRGPRLAPDSWSWL
jgi:hypothetical protein